MENPDAANRNNRSSAEIEKGARALVEIRDAAMREDQDFVDTKIQAAVQYPEVMAWAEGALSSESSVLQDLALALWRASGKEPDNETAKERLRSLRQAPL